MSTFGSLLDELRREQLDAPAPRQKLRIIIKSGK